MPHRAQNRRQSRHRSVRTAPDPPATTGTAGPRPDRIRETACARSGASPSESAWPAGPSAHRHQHRACGHGRRDFSASRDLPDFRQLPQIGQSGRESQHRDRQFAGRVLIRDLILAQAAKIRDFGQMWPLVTTVNHWQYPVFPGLGRYGTVPGRRLQTLLQKFVQPFVRQFKRIEPHQNRPKARHRFDHARGQISHQSRVKAKDGVVDDRIIGLPEFHKDRHVACRFQPRRAACRRRVGIVHVHRQPPLCAAVAEPVRIEVRQKSGGLQSDDIMGDFAIATTAGQLPIASVPAVRPHLRDLNGTSFILTRVGLRKGKG